MSDIWFYADTEGRVGPLTLQELKETLATHQNPKAIVVWSDHHREWRPANDVLELQTNAIESPPPQNESVQSPTDVPTRLSLVKCKDCGGDVSKNATQCPHCGAPIKKQMSSAEALIRILWAGLCLCFTWWWLHDVVHLF